MGLAIEMQSVSYSLVSLGGQTFDYGRVRGQAVAIAKPLALVFGTAAIAGTGIYLYLKTSEDALKETRDRIKDEIDKKRRGASVVFHYTDKVSAIGILATGFMATSPPFRGSFVTYPQGAYASTIPPYSSSITQSQLSAHFYGGNVSKDVSMAVIIDSYGFLPVFGGPPDFRYKLGPLGGLTDVRVYGVIPNLMDPK